MFVDVVSKTNEVVLINLELVSQIVEKEGIAIVVFCDGSTVYIKRSSYHRIMSILAKQNKIK